MVEFRGEGVREKKRLTDNDSRGKKVFHDKFLIEDVQHLNEVTIYIQYFIPSPLFSVQR